MHRKIMYRKIAIGGVTAAVILGAGTAALATSGSTTSGQARTTSGQAKTQAAKHPKLAQALRRTVHAEVVTRAKDGTFVTHEVIRGAVTAVSPTSISVKAADGMPETFVVNSATKVRVRSAGKGGAGKIGDVKVGDGVIVAGTGKGAHTAKHIIDGIKATN